MSKGQTKKTREAAGNRRKLTRAEKKQIAAVIRQAKGDGKAHTAQQTIPYLAMYPDGICKVAQRKYSKSIAFEDINYQLAQADDKTAIFENWCDFLNYFDASVNVQLSFINQGSQQEQAARAIHIPPQNDDFNSIRTEYSDMLKMQLAKGNNGLVKHKYITFSIEADNPAAARARLSRIETDVLNNFKVLGVSAHPLSGYERLKVLHGVFHPAGEPFSFSYDWLTPTGLTTKDFIAPSSFKFGERVMEHLDAAHTRKASKKAVKKAQEAAVLRTSTSRLQFTDEERETPKLQPYIKKSEKAADKLDAAKAALPKQKKLVKERTFEETTGKAKTRLRFEEQEKPIPGGKAHSNPLSHPAQEAGIFVHNKIHSVEKDNSGVEGAHKSEELAERGARYGTRKLKQGYRSHKLKPYREAAKAEQAAFKANVNFQYHKALQENPQLTSNPFSRFMQKQKIKRQYAKTVKKSGSATAKAAAGASQTAAKKAAAFAGRHPAGVIIAIAALLLFIMVSVGLSSCGAMFSGSMNSVLGTSYTSEDSDLVATEQSYAAKDTRQHNTWRFYGEQTRDTILAYAVELTGTEQEKIKGNLYELDYLQHFREVIEKSIPADNYTLIYEHGELTKPAGQYFDGDTDPQLGKFIRFEAQPNDPEALKSLLREQQKKRTPHTQRDFQLHIAALHDRQIETEARRIVENVKGLGEPDSPEKTHCAVELSPYFVPLATDKDMERLLSMLPYKSLSLSTLQKISPLTENEYAELAIFAADEV